DSHRCSQRDDGAAYVGGGGLDLRLFVYEVEVGPLFGSYPSNDARGGRNASGQHGNALLDDARFFECDLLHGFAQVLDVIQPDIRDDGQVRSDDVRGVQAPTHSHLHHREIDLHLCEIQDAESDHHFEVACIDAMDVIAVLQDGLGKPIGRRGPSVD